MATRPVLLNTGAGPDEPVASGSIRIRRFNPGVSDDGTFIHATDEAVTLTLPASTVDLEVGEYYWFTPSLPAGERIVAQIPSGSGSIDFADLVPVDPDSLLPSANPGPAWLTNFAATAASHVADGSALDAALTAKILAAMSSARVGVDTDGVPYFQTNLNFEDAVPVLADTDGVPYFSIGA